MVSDWSDRTAMRIKRTQNLFPLIYNMDYLDVTFAIFVARLAPAVIGQVEYGIAHLHSVIAH